MPWTLFHCINVSVCVVAGLRTLAAAQAQSGEMSERARAELVWNQARKSSGVRALIQIGELGRPLIVEVDGDLPAAQLFPRLCAWGNGEEFTREGCCASRFNTCSHPLEGIHP